MVAATAQTESEWMDLLLAQPGADIDAADQDGWSARWYATETSTQSALT